MTRPTCVIGKKAYTPWSLRPRLLMRRAGIDFEEARLLLYAERWNGHIAACSPCGEVQALIDREVRVQDALATAEYAP